MEHWNGNSEQVLDAVKRALAGLKFGTVEIVVHDSKIVQVERREKVRLLPENARKHDSAHAVGASK